MDKPFGNCCKLLFLQSNERRFGKLGKSGNVIKLLLLRQSKKRRFTGKLGIVVKLLLFTIVKLFILVKFNKSGNWRKLLLLVHLIADRFVKVDKLGISIKLLLLSHTKFVIVSAVLIKFKLKLAKPWFFNVRFVESVSKNPMSKYS